MLRRLEAMLAVADRENSLIITGNGDVLEPEHGIVAIGSGGAYAQSGGARFAGKYRDASRGYRRAFAGDCGDLCIYTNQSHTIELIEG